METKKKVNIEIHKMKNKKTAYAMSHQDFDIMCATNHWNDSNIEELTDRAFISIVSSDECQKYYSEEIGMKFIMIKSVITQ